MKKKYYVTEDMLRRTIKESIKKVKIAMMNESSRKGKHLLKEGPGAGYLVSFKSIPVSDVKVSNTDKPNIFKFTATIPEFTAEWDAEGYYGGPSSEGVFYDYGIVEEYTEEENTVAGGTIEGVFDIKELLGNERQKRLRIKTKKDVEKVILEMLYGMSFKKIVGGGYSHTNLENPMVFNNVKFEYEGNDYSLNITLDAEGIVNNINWWFDNWANFEEIYGSKE